MNVLLVTLDTVRCSHVGCYGYEHDTTPNIDKFSELCVKAENALTVSPITLSAHASILSSLYPFQHGLRDNGSYYMGDDTPTLPKILQKNGFETGAFVGCFVLDKIFGLDKGFDVYDDTMSMPTVTEWQGHKVGNWERSATDVSNSAIKWLGKHMSKDFFMWVHYFDCHMPYNPPEQFKDKIKSDTCDYDNGLKYVDYEVGRLLNFVKQNNLLDDTLIVIVGDHGEAFGEHDERGHGLDLQETTIQVPFLVYKPKADASNIKCRVTVLDVAPTILSYLKIDVPKHMCGVDVFGLCDEGVDRDFHTETYYRGRLVTGDFAEAIYSGDSKYINYAFTGWHNRDGFFVIESSKDTAFDLWLINFKKQYENYIYKTKKVDMDEKLVRERLKSLGYL